MRVLALSGGVGGAKLCEGLAAELTSGNLTVLVNTADDFTHLGLSICPDIDTVLYTLSGRASKSRGWGLSGETWQAMDALAELGGESWFRLGDRDLATHLLRSEELAAGASLSEVTLLLAERMGIDARILPMSDDAVRTVVQSNEGDLPFQDYFVRRQCEPEVTGFRFEGLAEATLNPGLRAQLSREPPDLVLICPSNPFVSVDPILQVDDCWRLLGELSAPVIAVSPIVAGLAIKGPAAKMMAELSMPVSAGAVLKHYTSRYPGLLDGFVIDESDATLLPNLQTPGIQVAVEATIMKDREQKRHLARRCLALAKSAAT
ncbi:MAG: 2-phospho-L-lactate transferase [Pseudomonadota bacterium]